jgi:hypothetical protein
MVGQFIPEPGLFGLKGLASAGFDWRSVRAKIIIFNQLRRTGAAPLRVPPAALAADFCGTQIAWVGLYCDRIGCHHVRNSL